MEERIDGLTAGRMGDEWIEGRMEGETSGRIMCRWWSPRCSTSVCCLQISRKKTSMSGLCVGWLVSEVSRWKRLEDRKGNGQVSPRKTRWMEGSWCLTCWRMNVRMTSCWRSNRFWRDLACRFGTSVVTYCISSLDWLCITAVAQLKSLRKIGSVAMAGY